MAALSFCIIVIIIIFVENINIMTIRPSEINNIIFSCLSDRGGPWYFNILTNGRINNIIIGIAINNQLSTTITVKHPKTSSIPTAETGPGQD